MIQQILAVWSSSPIPVNFSSLIPKTLMFILSISYLTTSNLPWFMDLTLQFLCNIVLYCIRVYFHHQSHPQRGIIFTSAQPRPSFWSCLSTPGHLPTWAVHFSVSLPFCLFILFMGFSGKNTEVVCHSLLQWTTFCQNSPPWPVHLGWPYSSWLTVSLN